VAGHQHGGEENLGQHNNLDANLQAGPIMKSRPMVQLLAGSAKVPLGNCLPARKVLLKKLDNDWKTS
jgi:hypothetical protein